MSQLTPFPTSQSPFLNDGAGPYIVLTICSPGAVGSVLESDSAFNPNLTAPRGDWAVRQLMLGLNWTGSCYTAAGVLSLSGFAPLFPDLPDVRCLLITVNVSEAASSFPIGAVRITEFNAPPPGGSIKNTSDVHYPTWYVDNISIEGVPPSPLPPVIVNSGPPVILKPGAPRSPYKDSWKYVTSAGTVTYWREGPPPQPLVYAWNKDWAPVEDVFTGVSLYMPGSASWYPVGEFGTFLQGPPDYPEFYNPVTEDPGNFPPRIQYIPFYPEVLLPYTVNGVTYKPYTEVVVPPMLALNWSGTPPWWSNSVCGEILSGQLYGNPPPEPQHFWVPIAADNFWCPATFVNGQSPEDYFNGPRPNGFQDWIVALVDVVPFTINPPAYGTTAYGYYMQQANPKYAAVPRNAGGVFNVVGNIKNGGLIPPDRSAPPVFYSSSAGWGVLPVFPPFVPAPSAGDVQMPSIRLLVPPGNYGLPAPDYLNPQDYAPLPEIQSLPYVTTTVPPNQPVVVEVQIPYDPGVVYNEIAMKPDNYNLYCVGMQIKYSLAWMYGGS